MKEMKSHCLYLRGIELDFNDVRAKINSLGFLLHLFYQNKIHCTFTEAHNKLERRPEIGHRASFDAITLLTNSFHLASSFLVCCCIFSLKCLKPQLQVIIPKLPTLLTSELHSSILVERCNSGIDRIYHRS